jgi:hypothetical protein
MCIIAMPEFLKSDGSMLNGLSNYIQYMQFEILVREIHETFDGTLIYVPSDQEVQSRHDHKESLPRDQEDSTVQVDQRQEGSPSVVHKGSLFHPQGERENRMRCARNSVYHREIPRRVSESSPKTVHLPIPVRYPHLTFIYLSVSLTVD